MADALYQPFPMQPGRRAQVWQHQPSYRRPRHFHVEPELNVVVRGRATLGVGSTRRQLAAGDVTLFEAGQDHELLDASHDLELFVVALTPELHDRLPPARAELPAGSAVECAADAFLAAAELHDHSAVEALVGDWFARLRDLAARSSSISRRAALHARSAPGASCSSLAARLGTHPSHLSRTVVRELGVPLVELRARVKLGDFVRLVDVGHSFTEAALLAEFGSYAQCHRVFRRATGCSPKEYFGGARQKLDAALSSGVEPHENGSSASG
jgi:AraC-like DNA-binding protein/mannose-6-phosphate isomerase-like protein (cupin superfamily)